MLTVVDKGIKRHFNSSQFQFQNTVKSIPFRTPTRTKSYTHVFYIKDTKENQKKEIKKTCKESKKRYNEDVIKNITFLLLKILKCLKNLQNLLNL